MSICFIYRSHACRGDRRTLLEPERLDYIAKLNRFLVCRGTQADDAEAWTTNHCRRDFVDGTHIYRLWYVAYPFWEVSEICSDG